MSEYLNKVADLQSFAVGHCRTMGLCPLGVERRSGAEPEPPSGSPTVGLSPIGI
jgi:hypothetical protein